MGIMSTLFFKGKDEKGNKAITQCLSFAEIAPEQTAKTTDMTAFSGNHNLQKERIFNSDGGFSPINNNFEGLRSVPTVNAPRYMTREQALALKQLEKEKTSGAKWTKRGYKSLKKIDDSDTSVMKSHYNYANKITSNETQKQSIKGKHAKKLHQQRPKYTEINQQYDQAVIDADNAVHNAINQIKSNLQN